MRILALFAFTAGMAVAGAADLSEAQINDIIQKFAAKETEFSRARENYVYRQTAKIFALLQTVHGEPIFAADLHYPPALFSPVHPPTPTHLQCRNATRARTNYAHRSMVRVGHI